MRLIDADRFGEVLDRYLNAPHVSFKNTYCEGMRLAIGSCVGFLDLQPTVDAVEVVRCKDCKHRGYVETCPMCWEEFQDYDENGGAWFDGITHDRTQDEYFCSCGERITDG